MLARPAGTHPDGPPAVGGGRALVLVTIAVSAIAFLLRFLTADFVNDHFVHLSRGWQILLGDVPIRDFFDPGLFLTYYASAAALWWSGHNLFGEALLTTGLIGLGVGLTFAVSLKLSRSFWIAIAAALLTLLSMPRLYNYPKAFLYVLALAVAWLPVSFSSSSSGHSAARSPPPSPPTRS